MDDVFGVVVGSGWVIEGVGDFKLPSLFGYLYVFSNCVEPLYQGLHLRESGCNIGLIMPCDGMSGYLE